VLTNIGKIIARKLIDLRNTIDALYTFESFRLEHDVSDIPGDLCELHRRPRLCYRQSTAKPTASGKSTTKPLSQHGDRQLR
jgi:hypothetical protein